MRNIKFKRIILGCLLFSFLLSCQQSQKLNRYNPYEVGDHLQYHNNYEVNYETGHIEKSRVFIIYEVLSIENQSDSARIKMKRYYSDMNGTVEDSIFNIYTNRKVYIIRPDLSQDSLVFTLGNSEIGTISDTIDSTGLRQVVKIVDNQASVTNSKGNVFDNCLKITTSVYDPGSPEFEFVFQKISYFKDTILVKYSSLDRRQAEIGVKEIIVNSELEEFNVAEWR